MPGILCKYSRGQLLISGPGAAPSPNPITCASGSFVLDPKAAQCWTLMLIWVCRVHQDLALGNPIPGSDPELFSLILRVNQARDVCQPPELPMPWGSPGPSTLKIEGYRVNLFKVLNPGCRYQDQGSHDPDSRPNQLFVSIQMMGHDTCAIYGTIQTIHKDVLSNIFVAGVPFYGIIHLMNMWHIAIYGMVNTLIVSDI